MALLILVTISTATVIFSVAIDVTHSSAAEARPMAGKASGTLTIDGESISLKYSYVMAQPNVFDKKKTDIAVLLTENPLAGDAVKDVEDLRDATYKTHGWAFFKIDDKGKPIHEVIDHPAAGGDILLMSGFTHAEFTSKKIGKDRVEGSFTTSKSEDFMSHKYEIRVDFSAPLLQAKRPEPLPNSKTGKALPGDGGEPGKAYRAYRKAILEKDIAALRETAPASQVQNATDEELKEAIEFMSDISPAAPKITSGFVKGDRAVLYLEGTLEGEKQYGTVEFAREKKAWYIVKENWSNTPPKK
jgi:hypothetical protein